MKRKILVIDTETGGLDPERFSILSLAAIVLDGDVIHEWRYWLIRESDIVTNPEAMKVNKLTREQVQEHGMSPAQVVEELTQLLLQNGMNADVLLAGHNAAFDAAFLKRLYRWAGAEARFENQFSRRLLCTCSSGLLLDQAGRIDLPKGSASLDSLVAWFNVPLDRGAGHNALYDAKATAGVLIRMLRMLK